MQRRYPRMGLSTFVPSRLCPLYFPQDEPQPEPEPNHRTRLLALDLVEHVREARRKFGLSADEADEALRLARGSGTRRGEVAPAMRSFA